MLNIARICLLSVILLTSCTGNTDPEQGAQAAFPPTEKLPQDAAGEIIRKSIAFATGGWEQWERLRSVEYKKTTVFVDENGRESRRVVQMHRYLLQPTAKMNISWEEDGQRYVIVNDGEQAWKWIDGERAESTEDRNHAWNSSFGSHYVFCMPFKLTDPGAKLSYLGRVELNGAGEADAVRVEYEPGAGSSGGMHTWTYFFSPDDGRLVANHLKYGDGPDDYDFTEYLDIKTVDGVRMPTRRYGYRSNAEMERLVRTSEIIYEDVRFDVDFPSETFDLSAPQTAGS